jgi:hypothetical protein
LRFCLWEPISCRATRFTWKNGIQDSFDALRIKSTRNRNHLCIAREVEAIGGNVAALASREQMGYTFDALRTCSWIPSSIKHGEKYEIDCDLWRTRSYYKKKKDSKLKYEEWIYHHFHQWIAALTFNNSNIVQVMN